MALFTVHFPSEVWNHIFQYLSAADKFSVRASCRYFRKLIDHWSLWKNWTIVLSFKNGPYNSEFWDSLRRRKVSSVVMRNTKTKDWSRLSLALPTLTTLIMDQNSNGNLNFIQDFSHLNRLAIRSSAVLLDLHTQTQLQHLTHLSMCNVLFPNKPNWSFLNLLPFLSSLTSVVCHNTNSFGQRDRMVDTLVSILPKLKHLSLSAKYISPQRDGSIFKPVTSLSSLELIDCLDHSSPEDVGQMISGLKCLRVFFKHSHQGRPEALSASVVYLKTWLSESAQLSNLTVVKGPPVRMYATSIPATVTNLTLCVSGLSPRDMAAVAQQVPDLLHLHIDAWPSHLGAHTARIPELFPKLRSLKLRQDHVPEKDFLRLQQLQDLECLEILDRGHWSDLYKKLQTLTRNRLRVVTSSPQRDAFDCPCVGQVY
uniref:F-box domain-containing protein n=1 Tax=Nothobranchius rachovii TaxID=451742 RepID=A0A1A8NFY1_9TELE